MNTNFNISLAVPLPQSIHPGLLDFAQELVWKTICAMENDMTIFVLLDC